MTFYLKAPGGEIPLHRLKEVAIFRLAFLERLAHCSAVTGVDRLLEEVMGTPQCDCLIEGNAKDRIAHHILRLRHMGHRDKLRLLKELERHLPVGKECTSIKAVAADVARHLRRSSDLNGASVEVPFEVVLSLVSERKVVLSRGKATVSSPDQFDVLFECLFRELLSDGIGELSSSRCARLCKEDARLDELCNVLTRRHRRIEPKAGVATVVRCEELDVLSLLFPPCMRLLYEELRRNHRLQHFSRVQLTLFMKEIGLPVDEALLFWQAEYSRPPSGTTCSTSCVHSWAKDERRYTYNIRHLYGLEGSKKDYSGSSCSTLQSNTFGVRESVSCPFVCLVDNDDRFRSVLLRWGLKSDDVDTLMALAATGRYSDACCVYYDWVGKTLKKDRSRVRGVHSENVASGVSFVESSTCDCERKVQFIDSEARDGHSCQITLPSRPTHFYRAIKKSFE